MFNPPSGVADGTEYTYGNMVWQYSATSGVWNIKNGTLIGGVGPTGNDGPQGNTGATGGGATGDAAAFIVNSGSGAGTIRLGSVGTTGVVGFGGRFDVSNGIASHKLAGASVTGVASFRNTHFTVDTTGHVQLAYNYIGLFDQVGTKVDTNLGNRMQIIGTTGIDFLLVSNDGGTGAVYQVGGKIANANGDGDLGVAWFNTNHFAVRGDGRVSLIGAYQITGDTVQAGSAIAISANKTISSKGVTSFNGLTGTVSLTGAGAVFGYDNDKIGVRVASDSVTGVASFSSGEFNVTNPGGQVSINQIATTKISGNVLVVRDQQSSSTNFAAGNTFRIQGQTGGIQTVWEDSATKVLTIRNLGVTAFNGATGTITVTGGQHAIPYIDTAYASVGGLTATNAFLFNGTSLTFGSSNSNFTVTGPNMVLGAATQITGGVFKNPTEAAPHYSLGLGVNQIVVNGISGSIQRYTINPTDTVTIKAGTGWHALTTATETIAVIIQTLKGVTAQFDTNILTDGAGKPVLFGPDTSTNYGITGGISVVTLMRVNKGGGAGLTMGFVISTGMTAPTASIN